MFIVEGSDHLGKTTLCRTLPGKYLHYSKPPDDASLAHYWPNIVYGNVIDRFHLGAIVYGEILGKHRCPFNQRGRRAIEHTILEMGRRIGYTPLAVIYTTDEEWYRWHLGNNAKEEMFDVDIILRANRLFPLIAPTWAKLVDIGTGEFPEPLQIWGDEIDDLSRFASALPR